MAQNPLFELSNRSPLSCAFALLDKSQPRWHLSVHQGMGRVGCFENPLWRIHSGTDGSQTRRWRKSGFEPLVPLATEMLIEFAKRISNATWMLAVGDIGPVPRCATLKWDQRFESAFLQRGVCKLS